MSFWQGGFGVDGLFSVHVTINLACKILYTYVVIWHLETLWNVQLIAVPPIQLSLTAILFLIKVGYFLG